MICCAKCRKYMSPYVRPLISNSEYFIIFSELIPNILCFIINALIKVLYLDKHLKFLI